MRTDYDPGRGGWGGSTQLGYAEPETQSHPQGYRGAGGEDSYESSSKRIREEEVSSSAASQRNYWDASLTTSMHMQGPSRLRAEHSDEE